MPTSTATPAAPLITQRMNDAPPVAYRVRLLDRLTLAQRGRDTATVRALAGVELTGVPVGPAPREVARFALAALRLASGGAVTRVDPSTDGRYWLQVHGIEIGWAEIDDSFALAASLAVHPFAAEAQALIDQHEGEIVVVTARRDSLPETDVMRPRLTHRIGQLRGFVTSLQPYLT